jgi:catechol 2,3-dioxygenase-like lactoylglutathione lyase family enzyme
MTKSRQPVSFIATQEPDKAKICYGDILGLELRDESPYALVFADGEHMLRVQIVAELSPASHTVHGWHVTNIEREMEALVSKGVEFLKFDQLQQNAAGVWTSPDGHKIAWFKDPSSNILSLTQNSEP